MSTYPADRTPIQKAIDLREVLWNARHYAGIGLLPILAVLCGAMLYLTIKTPRYATYATIGLAEQPHVSQALEPLLPSTPLTVRQGRETFATAVAKLDSRIHSRPFLEEVADWVGLTKDPELLLKGDVAARRWPGLSPQEYVRRSITADIVRRIEVVPTGQSYFRVTVHDTDPARCQRLAQAVAEVLLKQSRQLGLKRSMARGEFSNDQIAVYEETLRKSENALRAYEESMIALRGDQGPVQAENLSRAREMVLSAESQIEQLRNRMRDSHAKWHAEAGDDQGPPILEGARAPELERQLSRLELEDAVAALGTSLVPGEADARTLKIGGIRQALLSEYEALARTSPGAAGEAARSLAVEIAFDRSGIRSLQYKKERLARMISTYLRGAQSSPRQQLELEKLRSAVQSNRDILLALRKEATSSRISAAMETSELSFQFSIVEPAEYPLTPSEPKPAAIWGAAILLGSVLSAMAIAAARRVGMNIRTVEQAEQELGTPVLGTIPSIEGWRGPHGYLRRHWAVISMVVMVAATATICTVHGTRSSSQLHGSDAPAVPSR